MKLTKTLAIASGLSIFTAAVSTADGSTEKKPKDVTTATTEEKSKPAPQPKEVPGPKVGDNAPDFTGTDDLGKTWKLSDNVGKKYVVVYFYPADFTTGCTRQAVSFRDNANALADLGVQVIGVSADSVANHEMFKQAWELNFPLLADEETKIAEKFGVPTRKGGRALARDSERNPILDKDGNQIVLQRKATFARWTYIIGEDGKIVYKNTRVNPQQDSEQVLEFIKTRNSDDAGTN